jgi:hypothetical protein
LSDGSNYEHNNVIHSRFNQVLNLIFIMIFLIFTPIISNFITLYRFDYDVPTLLPIIFYLLFGALFSKLLWRSLFRNDFQQKNWNNLILKVMALVIISGIIMIILFKMNYIYWQSSNPVLAWLIFSLLIIQGLLIGFYFTWPERIQSKIKSPEEENTRKLSNTDVIYSFCFIILVIGFNFMGINWFYLWEALIFLGIPVYIFYPKRSKKEKQNSEMKDDKSVELSYELDNLDKNKLKWEWFYTTGRNIICFYFCFFFASNTYLIFWILDVWVLHFSIITIIGLFCWIFLNRLRKNSRIRIFLEKWSLVLLGCMLFPMPFRNEDIYIYLLDIVYGLYFGLFLNNFTGNKSLYFESKWKPWRTRETIYYSYIFLSFLAGFSYYWLLGIVQKDEFGFSTGFFIYPILGVGILLILIFNVINKKK